MAALNQILQKLGYHSTVNGSREGRIEFSCNPPTYAVNNYNVGGENVIVFKKGSKRIFFGGGINLDRVYNNYKLLNQVDRLTNKEIIPDVPTDELEIAIEVLYHIGFKEDFTVNICKGHVSDLSPTRRQEIREEFERRGLNL